MADERTLKDVFGGQNKMGKHNKDSTLNKLRSLGIEPLDPGKPVYNQNPLPTPDCLIAINGKEIPVKVTTSSAASKSPGLERIDTVLKRVANALVWKEYYGAYTVILTDHLPKPETTACGTYQFAHDTGLLRAILIDELADFASTIHKL